MSQPEPAVTVREMLSMPIRLFRAYYEPFICVLFSLRHGGICLNAIRFASFAPEHPARCCCRAGTRYSVRSHVLCSGMSRLSRSTREYAGVFYRVECRARLFRCSDGSIVLLSFMFWRQMSSSENGESYVDPHEWFENARGMRCLFVLKPSRYPQQVPVAG